MRRDFPKFILWQADWQTDRQADRQTDRQTDRLTDRQSNIKIKRGIL